MRESTGRIPDPSAAGAAKRLAAMVLQEHLSLDEGMLRSRAGGFTEEFIASLNQLAGIEGLFDAEVLIERLDAGVCKRAVEGKEPVLCLPREVQDWQPPLFDQPEDKPQKEEDNASLGEILSAMQELEKQADHNRKMIEETRGSAAFLEALCKSQTQHPKPWVGSLILTGITLLVSGYFGILRHNMSVASGILIGGLVLAALLLKREMGWYIHMVRNEKIESENRMRTLQLYHRRISELQEDLEELRTKAHSDLLTHHHLTSDEERTIRRAHPTLFRIEI